MLSLPHIQWHAFNRLWRREAAENGHDAVRWRNWELPAEAPGLPDPYPCGGRSQTVGALVAASAIDGPLPMGKQPWPIRKPKRLPSSRICPPFAIDGGQAVMPFGRAFTCRWLLERFTKQLPRCWSSVVNLEEWLSRCGTVTATRGHQRSLASHDRHQKACLEVFTPQAGHTPPSLHSVLGKCRQKLPPALWASSEAQGLVRLACAPPVPGRGHPWHPEEPNVRRAAQLNIRVRSQPQVILFVAFAEGSPACAPPTGSAPRSPPYTSSTRSSPWCTWGVWRTCWPARRASSPHWQTPVAGETAAARRSVTSRQGRFSLPRKHLQCGRLTADLGSAGPVLKNGLLQGVGHVRRA